MKIVMLCDFFQEGLEYQENHLVNYYVKYGHEVTVICSLYDDVFAYYADKPTGRTARQYTNNGALIIKLPYKFNILNKLRAYTPIFELLEIAKPDLIFVHDIMLNFPECISYVKRFPETRMIMDYHADYCNSGKNWLSLKILHGVIRKWYLDRARPYLEKIFPIVPASTQFLHEVYGVPYDEMELLPLGTDLECGRAIAASGPGHAIRADLGIADGDLAIFTGGKLTPAKKTDALIDAVAALARPDVHLLIIGTAGVDEQSYFASLIDKSAQNPRIHFRGWQDKDGVYAHLDAADLSVFPASQSVLWQQSIGMGLPVIVGDRSEYMLPSDASYLNRHHNLIVLDHEEATVPQLARLIVELADDRVRLAAMAAGALKTADEMLDWNKLIAETLRFNLRRVGELATS